MQVATREGREPKAFEKDALDVLMQYNWPGNVRELFNICERASVLTRGMIIEAETIRPWLQSGIDLDDARLPLAVTGPRPLEEIERESILETLEHFDGNRARTAEALGIGLRTLGLKLKKWKEMQLVAETV